MEENIPRSPFTGTSTLEHGPTYEYLSHDDNRLSPGFPASLPYKMQRKAVLLRKVGAESD